MSILLPFISIIENSEGLVHQFIKCIIIIIMIYYFLHKYNICTWTKVLITKKNHIISNIFEWVCACASACARYNKFRFSKWIFFFCLCLYLIFYLRELKVIIRDKHTRRIFHYISLNRICWHSTENYSGSYFNE